MTCVHHVFLYAAAEKPLTAFAGTDPIVITGTLVLTYKTGFVDSWERWRGGRTGDNFLRTGALGFNSRWRGCAISTERELVLHSGQTSWRGHSTEHVREEEGIVRNRVSIHVTRPRRRAGRIVTSHCQVPSLPRLAQALRISISGCPKEGIHPPKAAAVDPRLEVEIQQKINTLIGLLAKNPGEGDKEFCRRPASDGPGIERPDFSRM